MCWVCRSDEEFSWVDLVFFVWTKQKIDLICYLLYLYIYIYIHIYIYIKNAFFFLKSSPGLYKDSICCTHCLEIDFIDVEDISLKTLHETIVNLTATVTELQNSQRGTFLIVKDELLFSVFVFYPDHMNDDIIFSVILNISVFPFYTFRGRWAEWTTNFMWRFVSALQFLFF